MPNPNIRTIRPGLLVALSTKVTGNVKYQTTDLEPEHETSEGTREAKWETLRVINDPNEHEKALQIRNKARTLITSACAKSDFGLLCPDSNIEKLELALEEAQALVADFNASAAITQIGVYVIRGRIAPDDLQAVRAINNEVRGLIGTMETGLANLDVKVVRDAANRAKNVGKMLSPDAAARIQEAIDAARACARKITKAGEQGAAEIDAATIRTLNRSRTAFLDMDEAGEVAAPVVTTRVVDLAPAEEEEYANLDEYVEAQRRAGKTVVQLNETTSQELRDRLTKKTAPATRKLDIDLDDEEADKYSKPLPPWSGARALEMDEMEEDTP